MKEIIEQLKDIKAASQQLMLMTDEQRRDVLLTLAQLLKEKYQDIIIENQKDLAFMAKDDSRYDRLLLTKERINNIAHDVEKVASLSSPLGQVLEDIKRPNGLCIKKIAIPLGVVAVIYEARPNVTIDVFALCFKTGNACVLKGGKEAYHTNILFVSLIKSALQVHAVDTKAVYLLPPERDIAYMMLNAIGLIDVCIPRGGQSLINFVRDNAKIPIIETGAGIVHTYFDESGEIAKGQLIINNAKTRRVSVCNALDTLIIHDKRIKELPLLVGLLAEKNVELFADEPSYSALVPHYPAHLLHRSQPTDYGCEFLAYKMAIKTVSSIDEALAHIMQYSSGHSEAIIAESQTAKNYFVQQVDAAAVYINASTAFTDGGQFGMGAEIGISTQKLHARGPMGLQALTSYKWVIWGDGQIREP